MTNTQLATLALEYWRSGSSKERTIARLSKLCMYFADSYGRINDWEDVLMVARSLVYPWESAVLNG